jgi:hypothetical protein
VGSTQEVLARSGSTEEAVWAESKDLLEQLMQPAIQHVLDTDRDEALDAGEKDAGKNKQVHREPAELPGRLLLARIDHAG